MSSPSPQIGFVSTRFGVNTDISVESVKWAQVLWDHYFTSYWYAGELERDPNISMIVPEADFLHPDVLSINERAFGKQHRDAQLNKMILELAEYLKRTLYEFVNKFSLDLLIIENALSIPVHIPLGLAIREFISETDFPAVAHHYDFIWEHERFAINAIDDLLADTFPPSLPSLQHVTINSIAQEELALRRSEPSVLVPSVLDFEQPIVDQNGVNINSELYKNFRSDIGLEPDDILFLQPTQIVPRKGIEDSINMIAKLNNQKCKLVVTGSAIDGDVEADGEYFPALQDLALNAGVDLRFVSSLISDYDRENEKGERIYSKWAAYENADLIMFPSSHENLGNTILEAVFFRKPIVVKRFQVFQRDFEPKGFRMIQIDSFLSESAVNGIRQVLNDPAYCKSMVDHNYNLANHYFSYSTLRRKLHSLVTGLVDPELSTAFQSKWN
ncbi:Glycosyl transferases group 1 [Gimesia alba]|uniref:Glycosyl transferases group 1 n=1 Tax=Gimesia alba TaxID=2527973 RepID=A0A517RHQ1_9PLAN|nr:glycosyltransferase family 4 protein [Gimesia alba]QDT43393.1 Glycosyl transferases group 1 [Gimesia alba]